MTFTSRVVQKIIQSIEQSEGVGAKVHRSIGSQSIGTISPFIMLDYFNMAPTAGGGFPDHPHRGQETVTYMLSGAVDHEDFAGHAGRIEKGGLQFMTAGKGIVHSEMPAKDVPDQIIGLQLWVDLPAQYRMAEPRYQELADKDIPRVRPSDKVTVKVISGQSHGVSSPNKTYVGMWYLDVEIKPGGVVQQELPAGWTAFAYTLNGNLTVHGSKAIGPNNTVLFESKGDGLVLSNDGTEDVRFVIIAGESMAEKQKMYQYGPFVSDTKDGIYAAFSDYQGHANGFERARQWKSKIGGL